MNTSTQQRILYAIAGSFLLGTVAALHWSISGVSESEFVSATTPDPIIADENRIAAAPTVDNKHLLGALRGPLYDPPPAVVKPRVVTPPPAKVTAPPSKPQLNLSLVGTIIDSEQSLAIIADESGKFDVKGIGDSLELSPEGVRIEQIDSDQITLAYQGSESTIRLEKNNQSSASNKRGNNRRRNQ